ALAAAGAEVVVLARTAAALDGVVAEITAAGGVAGAVVADVGSRPALERAAGEVTERFGDPDIVVTAAAVNLRPPLDELTVEQWDRTMAVNLDAPFLLGRRFGPRMAARGWGRIIHLASQQSV